MEPTIHSASKTASTRAVVTKYLDSKHTDASVLADDVVFTNMASGDRHEGPEAVLGMLHYLYHVAFDADAEIRSLIVESEHAVMEADFVGTHIGEIAGVAATNRRVRVPLCVVYRVDGGKIKSARIYFEVPALMEQLG